MEADRDKRRGGIPHDYLAGRRDDRYRIPDFPRFPNQPTQYVRSFLEARLANPNPNQIGDAKLCRTSLHINPQRIQYEE
jgi:hypothetical protein